jgi:hypothetical protein
MDRTFSKLALLLTIFLWGAGAHAISSLQLGEGTGEGWEYTSETWLYSGSGDTFDILATANATDGNGDYAWDALGATSQYAYLIVAAVPQLTVEGVDYFDVSVEQGGDALTYVTSGIGTPPLEDSNSIAPHGIFDTYFEIYEFQFDGDATTISDTQPGETGTGNGFEEMLDITINSLDPDALGIHFDLFTTTGGQWLPNLTVDSGIRMLLRQGSTGTTANKWLVNAFAPPSHDAGTTTLSEPGTLGLMLMGLVGVGASRIRRRRSRK